MRAGPEDIAQAVARLRAGRLVAFPTETVYGLGADALDQSAVARVFERKGRPASNPLIVHVSGAEMAHTAVADWPMAASELSRAFWPGPLTMVLPKADAVPAIVTGGGPTVGVRCPDHPVTLALIEAFGRPIVGPSANPSGTLSATTADHVRDIWPDDGPDDASGDDMGVFVLDGGPCRAGIESTVVDLTGRSPVVLRPGVIGAEALARVLGCEVRVAPDSESVPDTQERSPGRLGPHYQPRSPVRLYTTLDELGGLLASSPDPAVVLSPPGVPVTADPPHTAVPMPGDARSYAAALYARLREADGSRPAMILVYRAGPSAGDTPENRAIWEAVAERMARASAS